MCRFFVDRYPFIGNTLSMANPTRTPSHRAIIDLHGKRGIPTLVIEHDGETIWAHEWNDGDLGDSWIVGNVATDLPLWVAVSTFTGDFR